MTEVLKEESMTIKTILIRLILALVKINHKYHPKSRANLQTNSEIALQESPNRPQFSTEGTFKSKGVSCIANICIIQV